MGLPVISPWLRLGVESVMCWQILAVRSLRVEAMKVYTALQTQSLEAARQAVSMIVGRDTARLDKTGVIKAAVETVAENTSDGIVAPLLFMAIGGAPLGFFYKAVNTMDSMLGYTELPYKNIGFVPAKMDDGMNYIPARLSALLMLAAGGCMGLDVKNGWRIFCRDRYNHASPQLGADRIRLRWSARGPAGGGCLLSRGAAQKTVYRGPAAPGQCGGYSPCLPPDDPYLGACTGAAGRGAAFVFALGGWDAVSDPKSPWRGCVY